MTQCLRGSKQAQGNGSDFSHVQNIIIGDNKLAAQAAVEQAQHEGFDAEILTNELQGEAREVGALLAGRLRDEAAKCTHPFCLIAGGETTVTIKGEGKGGRNQELALAAAIELGALDDVMLIALATVCDAKRAGFRMSILDYDTKSQLAAFDGANVKMDK